MLFSSGVIVASCARISLSLCLPVFVFSHVTADTSHCPRFSPFFTPRQRGKLFFPFGATAKPCRRVLPFSTLANVLSIFLFSRIVLLFVFSARCKKKKKKNFETGRVRAETAFGRARFSRPHCAKSFILGGWQCGGM